MAAITYAGRTGHAPAGLALAPEPAGDARRVPRPGVATATVRPLPPRATVAVVVAGLVVAVVAAATFLLTADAPRATSARGAIHPPAVAGGGQRVVQPGDTYWSIAEDLAGDGDVRPVVDRLVAATGGAPLQPGDVVPPVAVP